MIKVTKQDINFVREPLAAPFGFKGKSLSELWQIIAYLESSKGNNGVGLGIESPLWSDGTVFTLYGELGSSSLMFLMTNYALDLCMDRTFENPINLFEELLPLVYEYGKKLAGLNKLRETFALNALVPVDNAAWVLYARENGINSFDEMVPEEYRDFLPEKQEKLINVPLITYGISTDNVFKYATEGSFFLKIKMGSDPEKDNDLSKMLDWDKKRIKEIHDSVKDIVTPYSDTGHISYYLDANGRYDSKERLIDFLNYTDEIGALERIILLEEPFSEDMLIDVSDIPVRVAADESAHSDKDVIERIALGYRAIALKPIAKTLSMTLQILKEAGKTNTACFCADLTVNPVMVDWNKNIAARIKKRPGLKIGVVESNGHQNYSNWDKMKKYHPCSDSPWTDTVDGIYELDQSFYIESGGIFRESEYYSTLV